MSVPPLQATSCVLLMTRAGDRAVALNAADGVVGDRAALQRSAAT